MRTSQVKTCKICGKSFNSTGQNHKYCSKECKESFYHSENKYKLWRDAFNKKNGSVVGIGSGGLTKSGKENPNYHTGIHSFRNYGRKLKDTGVPCNRCGKDLTSAKRGEWCSHHKDHNRLNNDFNNLELLCKKCHQLHHDAGVFLPNLRKVQRLSSNGVGITSAETPSIPLG